MKNFIYKVNHIMAELSGLSLGFIMVFLVIDVICRTVSIPILGASEMAIFSMLIAVYLGLPLCEEGKAHVRVEALLIRIPCKYRKIINLLSQFLVLFMVGIVLYAVGKYTLLTYKTKEAIAGPVPLRISPVLFVMFISCLFYWAQILINFLELFKGFRKNNKEIRSIV